MIISLSSAIRIVEMINFKFIKQFSLPTHLTCTGRNSHLNRSMHLVKQATPNPYDILVVSFQLLLDRHPLHSQAILLLRQTRAAVWYQQRHWQCVSLLPDLVQVQGWHDSITKKQFCHRSLNLWHGRKLVYSLLVLSLWAGWVWGWKVFALKQAVEVTVKVVH
jgi:hypothetical protein